MRLYHWDVLVHQDPENVSRIACQDVEPYLVADQRDYLQWMPPRSLRGGVGMRGVWSFFMRLCSRAHSLEQQVLGITISAVADKRAFTLPFQPALPLLPHLSKSCGARCSDRSFSLAGALLSTSRLSTSTLNKPYCRTKEKSHSTGHPDS